MERTLPWARLVLVHEQVADEDAVVLLGDNVTLGEFGVEREPWDSVFRRAHGRRQLGDLGADEAANLGTQAALGRHVLAGLEEGDGHIPATE